MGLPEKKGHIKKTAEAKDVTTCRSPTTMSAGRRPGSTPTLSGKPKEPQSASEPPKTSAIKNAHPTRRSIDVTTCRPPTTISAGRRPRYHSAGSTPTLSGKPEEPQSASEPPKTSAIKNAHPTTRSIDVTTCRPPTTISAGRRPRYHSAGSTPTLSGKPGEPQSASEPPKTSAIKNAHPTTRSIDVTTCRPPTTMSAGRRPRSTPTPSGKPEEPQSASEPPKTSAIKKQLHPTTCSIESAKVSSDSKKVVCDSQVVTGSKAAGDSRQPVDKVSGQVEKISEATYNASLPLRDIEEIEKKTRGQRNNPDWHQWRQNRITASLAHKISHSKFANDKTSDIPQSYLKAVLGTEPKVQTPAMTWGIRNEKKAISAYEKQASENGGREVQVEDCGLFIHPTRNWLAASPDGIVKDKITGERLSTLEVKCPYKHKDHTVREACTDPDFCLTFTGDSYTLKPKHAYYTQVQCQMASTGISNADFVVHTNKETVIVPISFNAEFWEETEPKLEKFHKKAVMPYVKKLPLTGMEEWSDSVYAPEE